MAKLKKKIDRIENRVYCGKEVAGYSKPFWWGSSNTRRISVIMDRQKERAML